jgi:Rieske Fe-S protein
LSGEHTNQSSLPDTPESEKNRPTRRDFIGKCVMGVGLLLSYGVLMAQTFLFLLPTRGKTKLRRIFIGKVHHFQVGAMEKVKDLRGREILIKRKPDVIEDEKSVPQFVAFSSVCPHLGCRVLWQEDKRHFLCPCHNGIFDENGVATSGPPAQAGQSLDEAPIFVDRTSGSVYIEVKNA